MMGVIERKFAELSGTRMAYTETGTGDPIVFLHGNPSSSYLWRHVIEEVASVGRCLAPDLIGMGDSDKLTDSGPDSCTFVEHREYLDAWFETVGATRNVILVGHDWGSALGFDWARRHPDAVRGIAYMEAAVRPGRWADFPPPAVELFRALRSPAGEQMILENNMFVEAALPGGVLNPLAPEVLSEYRRPFTQPGDMVTFLTENVTQALIAAGHRAGHYCTRGRGRGRAGGAVVVVARPLLRRAWRSARSRSPSRKLAAA
jgi:haloalkane dehalogenase